MSHSKLALEPTTLAGYELVEVLGMGGFGRVFEAHDTVTGQRFALKVLSRVSPRSLSRFKQEFRTVQGVHHPNLVRLEALIEHEGRWLIVMELVEGTDLLSYVRAGQNDPGFNEARLRSAFAQLADALSALHAAGIVHRDLKPSNVRVTDEGRVVLLDFGLATHLDPNAQSTNAVGAGTVTYMAPEQAGGNKVGPPADWYAFGVSLYEGLTGEFPIAAGTALELALLKQSVQPAPPSHFNPALPPDLDRLCVGLLAISPEERLGADEVQKTLSSQPFRAPVSTGTRGFVTDMQGAFLGRERELSVLEQNLSRTRSGEQRVVWIEGDSGIGKSELTEHFLRRLAEREPDALILRSRCYENELLAYKAFDGALDELARFLLRLSAGELRQLLPPRTELLCRVFPVFARVDSIAKLPPRDAPADPAVLRMDAFRVLSQLLGRLAQQSPVVLAVDDLQWADAESFRLLQVLMNGGETAPVLLVVTARPLPEIEPAVVTALNAAREKPQVEVLPLGGLDPEQATALAGALLGPRLSQAWLQSISRESRGHPLFLTVLARFAESHDLKATADLTLDAALGARIGGLSREARRLLYVAALAGSPQSAQVCARAADVPEQRAAALIAELCGQKLLRRRRASQLACFHDQVRHAALAELPEAQARELHGKLAEAMEDEGRADPGELARHYEAAGDGWLAFLAYKQAAKASLNGFAFARAAALFARAIELTATMELEDSGRIELMVLRGHALARAGRSAEAAEQYLAAVPLGSGEQKIELRLWAAQHLLQSAQVEAGMRAARELLRELNVPLADTKAGLLMQVGFDRMMIRMRGLTVKAPRRQALSPQERLRVDALRELAMPLNLVDVLPGAVLTAKHLRKALALGDARFMAETLAVEATLRAVRGAPPESVETLLARAREFAKGAPAPDVEARMLFNEGASALTQWKLAKAVEHLKQAEVQTITRCPDRPFLLTNIRMLMGFARSYHGDHAALIGEGSVWLAEARERNDRFATAALEGFGALHTRFLMRDDPEGAREAMADAMAPWPREPYSYSHHGEVMAVVFTELYRGGRGALTWLEAEAPRLNRAILLKVGTMKAAYMTFWATARLSAWVDAPKEKAHALLRQAKADAEVLRRSRDSLALLQHLRLQVVVALCEGRDDDARELLLRLRRDTPVDHHWMSNACTYMQGLLEGGEGGRERERQSISWLRERGWQNPKRTLRFMWPVLDWYEAKRR